VIRVEGEEVDSGQIYERDSALVHGPRFSLNIMKRRNAPSKIQLDKDESASTTTSSSSVTPQLSPVVASGSSSANRVQVPLFKRKLSTKRGSIEPRVELDTSKGTAKIVAPGTPWEEMDLSSTFLNALHQGEFEPKRSWWSKRRAIFIIGGLLGVLLG
jgi:phospholipid:diacylglycerol acyltransferase